MRKVVFAVVALSLASCGSKPEDAPPASVAGSSDRFGPLMLQVGHRLELSGRAAQAGRWDLAAYEVEELTEIYEGPLLDAPAPADVHARIEPFITSCLDPLEAAARAHDLARFEQEFRTTTIGCNACHATAGVAFVEIPTELGVEVPRMTPVEGAAPPSATLSP